MSAEYPEDEWAIEAGVSARCDETGQYVEDCPCTDHLGAEPELTGEVCEDTDALIAECPCPKHDPDYWKHAGEEHAL